MGTSNYSDEFKRDAVHQMVVRGYPVREVSRRLGVSTHSLYKWMKLFGDPAPKRPGVDHEAENRRLKRELARMTEECQSALNFDPLSASNIDPLVLSRPGAA